MAISIPRLTSTSIIGSGLVVLAGVAEVLHLVLPGRPIGEPLIGGFLAAGLHIWAMPQKAAPVAPPTVAAATVEIGLPHEAMKL